MFGFMETPPIFPPQASKFAEQYDLFFWYLSAVVAVGGAAVYALLTYCCFRFAKTERNTKPQRILGSNKLEVVWTVIPLLFFLSFFVWGARIYDTAINIPAEASKREYFVVGKQWMWKVQDYDGLRHINELTLEEDVPVKITGTSEDVIHDFGVPAFRSKFDVVPGRYTNAWYHPTLPGTYHLFCDQYCGQGHSQMVGKVHVLSHKHYEEWKEGVYRLPVDPKVQTVSKNPVDGSPAWQGRLLFLKLQCNGCHFTPQADDPYPPKAPTLESMWMTKREIEGGRPVTADDTYIRTAIRNPSEHVRGGWKAIMPAFHSGLATENDIYNLTAFIKSLKPGDLPYRNERSPTPLGGAPKASQGNPNPDGGKK